MFWSTKEGLSNRGVFYRIRVARAKKAGQAAFDAVIAGAHEAAQDAAYAAAAAVCKARNAAPETAEMVIRTLLDNDKLSAAELIERRESGAIHKVYELCDDNAYAAHDAAMMVIHEADDATKDAAREAFDAAYAASMRASGYWPE